MENILGIDIGGSKIKMVLWNNHKPLKEWKTEKATLENFKKGLANFDCEKIGIGAPGLLDFKTGALLRCGNLPEFKGLNFRKLFGQKVKVDNDAKCFLRAEMAIGAGRTYKSALGVIFGTGIGGAINGWRGKNGWAGEFGHMIIDKSNDWEKLYQETKNKPKEQEKINAIGIVNLINIFNPEVIILGGKGARLFSQKGTELISKYLLLPKQQMPKIVLSKLGDNAVSLGAALLFEWCGV